MSSTGSLNCQSFEVRIQQILDDRLTLTGDDLLMSHAEQCPDCMAVLNDYESVDDSSKLLPAELAQILDEANTRTAPNRKGMRRIAILCSLAAMIVISLNIFHGLDKANQVETPTVAQKSALINRPNYGIADPGSLINNKKSHSTQRRRKTPDTSPFSKNFSIGNSIPNINITAISTIPNWHQMTERLDPLESVLTYSSNIPGILPVHCSFNFTINVLKQAFSKPEKKPDLGFWIDSNMLAAV